jgi:hypothetical protein
MQAFPRPSVTSVVKIFLTTENTTTENTASTREVLLTNATVGL